MNPRHPGNPGRRSDDTSRTASAHHNRTLLRLALGIVLAYAALATAAYISARVQEHNDRTALNRANQALTVSRAALARDTSAFSKAVHASQLTRALASERTATIIRDCQAQNRAHDATILELDYLLQRAKAHVPRAQRHQLAESRQFTVLLIDRLDAKQNCAQVAARANDP